MARHGEASIAQRRDHLLSPRGGFARLLVISPHLDDGVLGCGDLLARHPGSIVVTVFAGGPRRWGRPTAWDAAAGFYAGQNVMAARQREDREAVGLLGCRPRWLGFWDAQYRRPSPVPVIRAALGSLLRTIRPDVVCLPLGLRHPDHRLVHRAARLLPRLLPRVAWFAYADAIHRRHPRAGMRARLAQLRRAGLAPVPVRQGSWPASPLKRRAVAAYRSQLRGLSSAGQPGLDDAFAPEQYWRLQPSRG